jgi:hypothetical protein
LLTGSPAARENRGRVPRHGRDILRQRVQPSARPVTGRDHRNGYRFAKCHGKPNSANLRKPASERHFCDFAADGAGSVFTPGSLRTLNCPSNLIGHDDLNKPANGERMIRQKFHFC